MIVYAAHTGRYNKETITSALLEFLKIEDTSKIGEYSDAALKYNIYNKMCYMTSEPKENIVDNTIEFFKLIRPNKVYYKTEKEYKDFYSKLR